MQSVFNIAIKGQNQLVGLYDYQICVNSYKISIFKHIGS